MARLFLFAISILFALGARSAAAQDADALLAEAVMFADPTSVERLLGQGADPNHHYLERPVLSWAAQAGDPALVAPLLAGGAAIDAVDNIGHTALMRAVELGHPGVVEMLLAAGADTTVGDASGGTVAHMAVRTGQADLVELLLRHNADFEHRNQDGNTPLMELLYTSPGNVVDMVRALARAGVDLDLGNDHYTPLYYAVEQGDATLVDTLLIGGADPDRATAQGSLPLVAAAADSHILGSLLAIGADPNAADRYGETPLFAVIAYGTVADLSLMLDAGADPLLVGDSGQSALQRAEAGNREDMLALIAERFGATDADTVSAPTPDTAAPPIVAGDTDELPMLQPLVVMDSPGVGLNYYSSASLPDLLRFYQARFAEMGWSERSLYTDEQLYASGGYRHGDEVYSLSLSLDTSTDPARVMVGVTAHGNLDAATLPRYPGVTATYEGDSTAIYTSADDIGTVAAETLKLLSADGWQGSVTVSIENMQQLTLHKGNITLTVMVSVAPAQDNRTSIQYSLLKISP